MSTAVTGLTSKGEGVHPNQPLIRWEDFKLETIESNAAATANTVKTKHLQGTQLSCIIDTEAGKWPHRKIFLKEVFADMSAHCPKNEPLAFISFGADQLLLEYVLGKSLIENGFNQISFFLVDPVYVFSEQKHRTQIQGALKDFRKNIEAAYLNMYTKPLEKDRIRYLSRSQNIDKYFPDNANVVVIEGLPPYGEIIKEIKKFKAVEKKPEDLLGGNYIIQPSHANAVVFIPKKNAEQMVTLGVKFEYFLPLPILQSAQTKTPFYTDWGCKIRPDGTYCLSFSGEEHYLSSRCVSPKAQVRLETNEVIQADQWIPKMKQAMEQTLSKYIQQIKGDDSQKQLSQEDITALLQKIQKVAELYMPGIECFFLADYVLDRAEAMTFISSHAGQHYRKVFSLIADVGEGYKITVDEIK